MFLQRMRPEYEYTVKHTTVNPVTGVCITSLISYSFSLERTIEQKRKIQTPVIMMFLLKYADLFNLF